MVYSAVNKGQQLFRFTPALRPTRLAFVASIYRLPLFQLSMLVTNTPETLDRLHFTHSKMATTSDHTNVSALESNCCNENDLCGQNEVNI